MTIGNEQRGDISAEVAKLQKARRKRARLPLSRVLTTAIVSALGLFVLVTGLAYLRLFDFRAILSDITEQSIPSVALSSQIYGQVNTLTYLSESLAKSPSEATRRLTQRKINAQLALLERLTDNDASDSFLAIQLNALKLELQELNALVMQRLSIDKQLQERQDRMYTLYDNVITLSDFRAERLESYNGVAWALTVSDAVALAGKASSLSRLHRIRQIGEQLSNKLSRLQQQVAEVEAPQRNEVRALVRELEQILMADNGLIALRIEQLRINGRNHGPWQFRA